MYSVRSATMLFVGIALVFSLSLVSVGAYAQSLDKRVEKLEKQLEKMEGDESPADKYVSEFGGRIMADFTFSTDGSDNLYGNASGVQDGNAGIGDEAEDGFEFRRVRLYAEGPIGKQLNYKIQLDFADGLGGGEVSLKDVYVNYAGLPWIDNLKVGHFKEPFSINEQTSSKYITFMSRSALTDGLSQARQAGAMTTWRSENGKYNFSLGAFNVLDDDDDTDPGVSDPGSNGSYDIAGRLTSPVVYENNGRKVVHLGVSGRESGNSSGDVTIGLEPEVHKGDPEFLEVSVPAESSTTYGLEAATVRGPASLQAEFAEQDVSTPSGTASDVDLESWYVMGSYFLTGEHRPYDPAAGDFGRIDVKEEWSGDKPTNSGAWEVAARLSNTDFTDAQGISDPSDSRDVNRDGGIDGADDDALADEMEVLTLGLNWYPHPHAKWMLNYVDAEQNALDGDAQWVTSRFQVDF